MFAFNLGPAQLIILLLLGVLLFGSRLPEVGRTLAKALREFRNAWHGIEDEVLGTVTRSDAVLAAGRPPQRTSAALPNRSDARDAAPSA